MPLLVAHGTNVTTRQIADAAGVAEGTIFRVFADKEAVIDAAVEAALDPAPTEAALAAIDRGLPFDAQLVRGRRRSCSCGCTEIWQLLSSARPHRRARRTAARRPSCPSWPTLFEPQRHVLRQEPDVAAGLLRGLVLAVSHPLLDHRRAAARPTSSSPCSSTASGSPRRPAVRPTRTPLR